MNENEIFLFFFCVKIRNSFSKIIKKEKRAVFDNLYGLMVRLRNSTKNFKILADNLQRRIKIIFICYFRCYRFICEFKIKIKPKRPR